MRSKSLQASDRRAISWFGLALIAGAAGLLGGVVALVMVALMVWLCKRTWVVDDSTSHGISEFQSSRLGGVAVLFGAISFSMVTEWLEGDAIYFFSSVASLAEKLPSYMGYVFLIALVGLWDDFATRFRPSLRLALVLAIAMLAFLSDDTLMRTDSYAWLPSALANSPALALAGTLVVAGFVNAGNMADGANGLLSIIGISFFSVMLSHDGNAFALTLIMSLVIFLVFNVTTGRIFLGDFGAYGLSAMIAFGSLQLYSSGAVSLWFLGSLLAYPCVELIRVMVSRALRGEAAMQAANDHLHNYLYELFRKRGWDRIAANSTTGCLLASISALIPASIVLCGIVEIHRPHFWLAYFAAYTALHLALVFRLERMHVAK